MRKQLRVCIQQHVDLCCHAIASTDVVAVVDVVLLDS
jgi:hypothetical protein